MYIPLPTSTLTRFVLLGFKGSPPKMVILSTKIGNSTAKFTAMNNTLQSDHNKFGIT